MRAPTFPCPCLSLRADQEPAGRRRGTPPSKTTHPPAKSRPRRRYFRALLPAHAESRGRSAGSTGARSEHCHPRLCLSNLRGPRLSRPHDMCLRGRVAGASLLVLLHRVLLLLQILIIQRVCVAAPAALRALAAPRSGVFASSQPASSSSSSNSSSSSSSSSSSDGAPSARSARSARVHTHFCPLRAPFRRLIRPLLVLAGAGDAAEPCRVSGDRLRPTAAAIVARGGAERRRRIAVRVRLRGLGRAWRAAAQLVVRAHVSVTESICYE